MKIKINIKNTRLFSDVVQLIDKESFSTLVEDLRIKWGIKKFFEDYDSFYAHISFQKELGGWRKFREDIKKVRALFNRSENFDQAIEYAIAFNEIPDGAYETYTTDVISDPTDPDNESKYKYAIFPTITTTNEDVIAALRILKTKMKAGLEQKKDPKKMETAVSNYTFELGPQYTPPSKKTTNIVRNREAYWMKKDNLSHREIAKKLTENGIRAIKKDVINGLRSFKAKLRLSI